MDLHGVSAAAIGRALHLLALLDREHTTEELHAAARAVRHELRTLETLHEAHPPPGLPPLANPPGEQITLM